VWFCIALTASMSLCNGMRAQDAPKKNEPNPDDLAKAGVNFGVSFYKGLGASYQSGQAQRAYDKAVGNATLDFDLSAIADAYKTKKEESRATANFVSSSTDVAIKGAVFVGLASGVGTVPTAIFAAVTNYANDEVANKIRAAGDQRALGFLKDATQNWQTTNGITFQSVKTKLEAHDTNGAIHDFDKATGMLTKLHDQLSDDPAAAEAALKLILDTMKNTTEASILQIGENTMAIDDLAGQARVTTKLFKQTSDALDVYKVQLVKTNQVLNGASDQIKALELSQTITNQQVGAIEDVLYDQQSAGVKIHLLQNGYKPGLVPEQRQQLITYFKAEVQKQELIADTAQVVNVAQELQGILGNLGIQDRTLNKAVQVGAVAQKALSAALTGNYLGAIMSVTSLFGSQSDPESEHFAAIMGKLAEMDKKLDDIIKLQIQTLEAIQTLSKQVADMDKRLNQRLDDIAFEVQVISDNLKAHMWQNFTPCNNAYQDRTADQKASFDNDSFNFSTIKDVEVFVAKNRTYAIQCAISLQGLFESIKNTNLFGRELSLRTAAATDFSVAPKQADRLTQPELKGFLDDLYTPSIQLVEGKWDPSWGATATLIALLGDPAANLSDLKLKTDQLDGAKTSNKPFHACSAPTVLSRRLRSLLCDDNLYEPIEVPKGFSPANENTASQRTASFMGDPLVRDQLPDLARYTGLVARPFDLWTGNGSDVFTSDQILAGNGQPRGKDLLWSLLSVLDIAVAQQAVLHGDLTAKVVYDLVWDKSQHVPVEPPPAQNPPSPTQNDQTKAIKLLMNANNPWLAKNVLMFAFQDTLYNTGNGGSPSLPYDKAVTILNSVIDLGSPQATASKPSDADKQRIEDENQKKIVEANFYLRGIFKFPESVTFTVADSDDGFGGRVRKILLISGSYKLEVPSPTEFAGGQFSYPPSLISLLRLREIMIDRLVDYQVLNQLTDIEQKKRLSAVLFSGLANPKPWTSTQ
jgi:hypothetical protein